MSSRPASSAEPLGRTGSHAELDEALCAAQAGDESGFAALYRAFAPRLLRYAAGLIGDDAPDVAAEAWLHIARDIRSFSGDADAFGGWAARILRNRAIDAVRHRARRPARVTDTGSVPDRPSDETVDGIAIERISTQAAIALIRTLPTDQADAVLLRVVVGLDAEAAGRVLGKRPGAVRVAAHRGLKSLARRLAEERHSGGL